MTASRLLSGRPGTLIYLVQQKGRPAAVAPPLDGVDTLTPSFFNMSWEGESNVQLHRSRPRVWRKSGGGGGGGLCMCRDAPMEVWAQFGGGEIYRRREVRMGQDGSR